jgi:hypothetical protein
VDRLPGSVEENFIMNLLRSNLSATENLERHCACDNRKRKGFSGNLSSGIA